MEGTRVQAARIHHHLHRADRRKADAFECGATLELLCLRRCIANERYRSESDLGNATQDRPEIDEAGIPAHRDSAVDYVDISALDTREGAERIFDRARAVGAVNALGVEDGVAFTVRLARPVPIER